MTVPSLGSDDIDDPLLLVRPDGRVLSANAAAVRLLGSDPVGHLLFDYLEDDPGRVRTMLGHQVRSTSRVPGTVWLPAPGGRRRVFGARRSAHEATIVLRFRSDENQFQEITRTLDRLNAEISRRIEVESHLQLVLGTTVLELEEANHRLRRFTGVVAHDLRAPLSVIVGLAEMLTEPQTTPEQKRSSAARIEAAALGLAELIETMHSEALASFPALAVDVDLAQVLAWVRHLNPDPALQLVPGSPLPVVQGSLGALRQVLLNLATNAVKHRGMQSQVCVKVSARQQGGWWEICVGDDGKGVPDHLLDRILERGVQLDHRGPGHGLGLDLCRSLVEQQGGHFWLGRSDAGGLAAFFTLRAATSSATSAPG